MTISADRSSDVLIGLQLKLTTVYQSSFDNSHFVSSDQWSAQTADRWSMLNVRQTSQSYTIDRSMIDPERTSCLLSSWIFMVLENRGNLKTLEDFSAAQFIIKLEKWTQTHALSSYCSSVSYRRRLIKHHSSTLCMHSNHQSQSVLISLSDRLGSSQPIWNDCFSSSSVCIDLQYHVVLTSGIL